MIHLGAMAIVAIVPLPWWVRVGLWAALAADLYITVRAHGLRTGGAVAAIELDRDGSWAIRRVDETTWHNCRLVDYWVYPQVVILRLRRGGARRAIGVVVAADAVAPDPFRRLRARLRLEGAVA